MRFCIDIDETICTRRYCGANDYEDAVPMAERISAVNDLYDKGHYIIYFTARGTQTGIDWRDKTEEQFEKWGVKYHELLFGKPYADFYIDDKAMSDKVLDVGGINVSNR